VCEALESRDIVFGTYRSHALYLAKGGDLNGMMAELYGKATGGARGKAGSMHLVDVPNGVMGGSAVVATTIPQAVGYAYALKLQRKDAVVVSFFGDGATEEGVFYESLNFAALKALPIIFICENNRYAIHTHQDQRQAVPDICRRVTGFGLPAETIEDDILQVHEKVSAKVQTLRSNEPGPFFFECMTYRWKEHVGPGDDFTLGYRTMEEAESWINNDQVNRIAQMLDAEQRASVEQEVEDEIQAAMSFAESSPFPDKSELFDHVFAGA